MLSKVEVNLFLQTVIFMKVNGKTTILMAKDSMSVRILYGDIKGNGSKGNNMEKENKCFKMGHIMRGSSCKEKGMVKANSKTTMAQDMRVSSKMVISMEQLSSIIPPSCIKENSKTTNYKAQVKANGFPITKNWRLCIRGSIRVDARKGSGSIGRGRGLCIRVGGEGEWLREGLLFRGRG